MDCCKNNAKEKNNVKGGYKEMEIKKKTLLWIIIGILVIVLLYFTFSGDSASTTGAVTNTVSAAQPSSGMVGGC